MYLIDGNNFARRKAQDFTYEAKRELLTQLAQFARLRRVRVCVVFDGIPDRHLPDGSSFQSVKIHFAQSGNTADGYIRKLLEQSRTPRDFTIVTNDRELQMGARIRQAKVVSVPEFRAQLETAILESTALHTEAKPTTRKDDVSQWLRYFGVPADENEPEVDDDQLFTREFTQPTTPNRGKGKAVKKRSL